MAFNYPGSSQSEVFPLENQYVVGIDQIEVNTLPLGSAPTVAWDITTKTLIFGIANNSAGLETIAAQIDNVLEVQANLPNINAVQAELDIISSVFLNLSNIQNVDLNAANIQAVLDNILKINAIAANISAVNSVYANIANINTTVLNIPDILSVNTNMPLLTDLVTNINDVVSVATDIDNINLAVSRMPDIISINSNIVELNTLVDNLADILNTNHFIPEIQQVSLNINDVIKISDNMWILTKIAPLLDDILRITLLDMNTMIANLPTFEIIRDNMAELLELANFIISERIQFVDQEYLGTAGQTDFTFFYTVNQLNMEVFYNGTKLSSVDWTKSGGDTVSIVVPVTANNDVIYIRAWNRIPIADVVTQAEFEPWVENISDLRVGTVADFEASLL